MLQFKKLIKRIIKMVPFYPIYHAQRRKIDWLTKRAEYLEQAQYQQMDFSSIDVTVNVLSDLLRSIGVDKPLVSVTSQDITDALKRNLLRYPNYRPGGNIDIQPGTEPRIFFFHIPKTGGSSMHNELSRFYHPLSIYPQDNLMSTIDEYGVSQAALSHDLRESCFTSAQYIERFPPYLSRLVSGHYSFDLFKRYVGVFDFIAILRDPAERLYSEFEYLRLDYIDRNRDNSYDIQKLNAHYGRPYFNGLTIRDFIEDNPVTHHGYSDNLLARLLADGVDNSATKLSDSKYTAEHYVETAVNNLQQFAYVGFLNDLDDFDKFMQTRYDFVDFNVSDRKDNQAKRSDGVAHAWQLAGFTSKKECIEFIRQSDACAIDNQIYAKAQRQFGRRRLSSLVKFTV